MLSDFGCLERENGDNNSLRKHDVLRKRSCERDDRPAVPARDSTSPSQSDHSPVLTSKVLAESRGSWKRNRTARKDGGAKNWENANTEVLQLPNGNPKTYHPGSVVWGKRDDGLRWPAQVCSPDESAFDKPKPSIGKHVFIKFFGLDDPDGFGPFSYLEPQALSVYTPDSEKLIKQSFTAPDDETKYEASIKIANEVYLKTHTEESLQSSAAMLERIEMQEMSKKKNRKKGGSGTRHRSRHPATDLDDLKDVDANKTGKRKRESKELKAHKCIVDDQVPVELLTDTQTQHHAKKRRLSAVHNGLNKAKTAKQETLQNEAVFRDKTRGDDGYFFECVVCDMGGNLLCCDYCPCTYHLDCLDPPLKRAPLGKWHCPACRADLSAVKLPASRGLDSKRLKGRKLTISTSDTPLPSPKVQKIDKDEAPDIASLISQKRKKSLNKYKVKKGALDQCCDTELPLQAQSCSICGVNIESSDHSSEIACLCKQCDSKRRAVNGGGQIREPDEKGISSAEVKECTFDEGERRIQDDLNKEASLIRLEVDRIFGCRLVSKSQSSGSGVKGSSQRNDLQLRSSLEVQSKSSAEARSSHVVPDSEIGTEQESNAWFISDQEKPPKGKTENRREATEATCSSSMVSGEAGLQTKKEDFLNEGLPAKSEDPTSVGNENEEGCEAPKDVNCQLDKPLPVEDFEFLVKWVGKSHIHDEWIKETELKILAKRKLDNYKYKYRNACINLVDEKWCKPQRIIAKRHTHVDAVEVLVKWCGLPYDECTWENIGESVIQNNQELLENYDYFEKAALTSEKVVGLSVDKQPGEFSTLSEQPGYIKGGTLFPHQMEALNWLRRCWVRKKNVILADEMGLGKTISASAFLCSIYKEFKVNAPCLVLVPLSTMPNWMAEFSMWTPELNVVEYHGSAKARATIRQFEWHATGDCNIKKDERPFKFNVLLTTYEMIIADASQLRSIPWEVLIVDEGHRLKNTGSKLVQLLNTFSFSQRVLLTGTPLQNNIGEMHNLLKFLQLDAFQSLSAFEDKFSSLSTAEQVEELKKLVAPHMLRRLKKDAMQNIPPKMERVVPVELSSLQAEYYRALLTKNYQVLRQAGRANQHQSLVNIVVQLRKVCNHPYLIPGTEPETGSADFLQEMRIKASAKLTLLHAMLRVLKEQGHRILIFSQMTRLLDILEDYLTVEFGNHTFERVDGSISVADRQAAIARFNQDPSRFVFLLSTRACGLGINLATADTVIIYDSDFNPHADIQAMNRAHRIGQSKRLLVYRLVVRASVEERILQLAKKKLMLDHLFANKSGSQKEVEDILKWGTEELFQEFSAPAEGTSSVSCAEDVVEGSIDLDGKQRKRSGGLGDVYEDTCHKVGRAKILWDDLAIARLLDRSEIGTEGLEAEGESDMLGSFKAWDWNEQDAAEDHEGNECLMKEKDAESFVEANIITSGQGTEEESDWDKILRTRWEKMQIEEEGALGRGKRARKTVSYKEDVGLAVAEVSSESGNEDEDPEAEYTPAGRALKNKLARLRARQKERIAARSSKDFGENYGPLYNASAGYSACVGSQLALPPCTMSMFLPVQLSEQDLQTLFSKSEMTANLISMQMNGSTGKVDFATMNLEASSAVRQPGISSEGVEDPRDHVDGTSDDLIKTETLPKSTLVESSNVDGGKTIVKMDPPLQGLTVGGQAGNCFVDGLDDVTGKLAGPNYVPVPDIKLEALNSQGCVSEKLESAEQSSLTKSPVESTKKLDVINTSPEFLCHDPGLIPEHRTELQGIIRSMECPEKSGATVSLGSANSGQSTKVVGGLAQGRAPKSEFEAGCGSSTIGNYFPQNDEVKGRSFPFLSQSGNDGAASYIPPPTTWTEEELDTLWSGVRRHGRGNWAAMLQDPKLCFSKLKTVKDLEVRWNEEQIKLLGGPFEYRDPVLSKDGSKPFLLQYCTGPQTPSCQNDIALDPGGPRDFINPAGLMQTRGFPLPDLDLESMSRRGSRGDTPKLPSLPQFGVDLKTQLPNFSSTSNNAAFIRDTLPWIDLGQKFDLPTTGLPKLPFPPDKQGLYSSRDRSLFSGIRSMSHSKSQSSPFQVAQTPVDFQTSGLLPRGSYMDNEWRLSNLQLKFEKGPTSAPAEMGELSKPQLFPDKLAQSLQDLPILKPNLNLLPPERLPELRTTGLHQKIGPLNVKGEREKCKASESAHPHSISAGATAKSNSSSLPHWLREAFKPSPADTPAMSSTIGAVCHAISLVYRECKPTLPAWVAPGPLPIAPHRKTKKRRKRKKGVGLGCRMMGDAHAGTTEQLGNVLLPNVTPPGKQNQLSMLGLGNSGLFDNRLHDTQQSLTLLNGSSLPAFPHTSGTKFDWHGGSDAGFSKLELQGQLSGLGKLPLPACTISDSMPLPSLPPPFMSYGQFVTSDLSLNSLFPKGKADQAAVQQWWPLPGAGSIQSLHIPPQSNPLDSKALQSDPPVPERQKGKCSSLQSEESSSKTHSDTCVKLSAGVQGNNDDASSEETVSDSHNKVG